MRARDSSSEMRLHVPWYFGGPVGSALAALVLRLIWRSSLRQLKRLVEGSG